MRGKTTEQFIEEAKKIHGDKYDYSLVDYKATNKNVKIICPIHGVFEQLPREHLHGHGCIECSKVGRKDSKDDFIEKAKAVHGDKYDYSKVEYKGYHTKVCIICPTHGEFWKTPAKHISSKQGCPKCARENSKGDVDLHTKETFIKKAKEIHGDKYDYSKVDYVDYKTKVCIICPIHGEFWQPPIYHLSGNGCRKCADEKTSLGQDGFIARCKEKYGDKYDYSKVEYKNVYTKVTIICPKHGEFTVVPRQFLGNTTHSRQCPNCSLEERVKSKEDFIEESRKVHGDKYDYSKVEYINCREKVCIICPKHGEFLQTPSNHYRGSSCPKCASEMNVNETRLFEILNNDFPQFEFKHSYKNKELLGKMELDIFSEKYNIAIEYQGSQHYNPIKRFGGEESLAKQIERDRLKREICKRNDILLLEFSFDKYEKQLRLITDYSELKDRIKKWLEKF